MPDEIVVKKICDYPGGPSNYAFYKDRPDAEGNRHPFKNVEEAYDFAERYLYAYVVLVNGRIHKKD